MGCVPCIRPMSMLAVKAASRWASRGEVMGWTQPAEPRAIEPASAACHSTRQRLHASPSRLLGCALRKHSRTLRQTVAISSIGW